MISALLFATVVGFCTPQPAVSPSEAVDRYISAYNGRDLAGIQATYSEDVRVHVWRQDGGAESYEIAQLLQSLSAYLGQNPQVQVAASQRVLLDTRLAQVETYSTGAQALVIYTVVGGCVVARDTYW
ncbi:MAG: hypothetical protein R3C31_06095 [Hyphomonadaceae bacterium]